MRYYVLLLPCLLACAGSPADINYNCTDVAYPAIGVTPVDAETGSVLASATIIVRDGAYADTAQLYEGLAYERAGTYFVSVTAPDHYVWNRSNVVVGADQCHVHTVRLTASLVPK